MPVGRTALVVLVPEADVAIGETFGSLLAMTADRFPDCPPLG